MDDHSLSFEDQYFTQLFTIETAIVEMYRTNSALLDFNVDKALNAAVRTLTNQKRDRKPPKLKLKGDEQILYDRLINIAAMYFGEGEFVTEDGEPSDLELEPLTIDEMIACFRRIQRSIKLMSNQGRQGYLEFIDQFFKGKSDATDPGTT